MPSASCVCVCVCVCVEGGITLGQRGGAEGQLWGTEQTKSRGKLFTFKREETLGSALITATEAGTGDRTENGKIELENQS